MRNCSKRHFIFAFVHFHPPSFCTSSFPPTCLCSECSLCGSNRVGHIRHGWLPLACTSSLSPVGAFGVLRKAPSPLSLSISHSLSRNDMSVFCWVMCSGPAGKMQRCSLPRFASLSSTDAQETVTASRSWALSTPRCACVLLVFVFGFFLIHDKFLFVVLFVVSVEGASFCR